MTTQLRLFLICGTLLAGACTSESPGTGPWQVSTINEADVIDGTSVTLEFAEEGRVAGSGGCNRYFGSVAIDGDRITFSEIGSTRMACEPAIMGQEDRFFAALGEAARFEKSGDSKLVILDVDDVARIQATSTVD